MEEAELMGRIENGDFFDSHYLPRSLASKGMLEQSENGNQIGGTTSAHHQRAADDQLRRNRKKSSRFDKAVGACVGRPSKNCTGLTHYCFRFPSGILKHVTLHSQQLYGVLRTASPTC